MKSNRVGVFNFDKNIPLEQQSKCPSCENELKTACVFVSEKSVMRMKYGICTHCGYMGYIDRPSKQWMIDFYSNDWDKAFPRTEEQIKNGTILPGKGIKPDRFITASLLSKINFDKNKPFVEMGSGYGEVLKYFKEQGFKTVVGVENSQHRAEMVQEVLHVPVFHGGFEEDRVQGQLQSISPIGLIFSHHVLEHVYNPAEVIQKASSLQEMGDHLILSLPNAVGEHINYALFYLVHLHSFTKESLEILLNKNGYELVADSSPNEFNTIIAAKKVQNPKATLQLKNNYLETFYSRVDKGMSVSRLNNRLNELYWDQREEYDFSQIISSLRNRFLETISWNIQKTIAYVNVKLRRFTIGYRILLEPVQLTNEGPLEIRFPNNIKFLIK